VLTERGRKAAHRNYAVAAGQVNMTVIVFVEAGGAWTEVEARCGDSVMRAAKLNGVAGIVGECGGSMTCLTCHCYVEPDRVGELPPPSDDESALLDCLLERRENSRLSCQILVTDQMAGMRFDLPAWQG
jgi:2Fe-2S ferredoxin